jgi:hypothetical protein
MISEIISGLRREDGFNCRMGMFSIPPALEQIMHIRIKTSERSHARLDVGRSRSGMYFIIIKIPV